MIFSILPSSLGVDGSEISDICSGETILYCMDFDYFSEEQLKNSLRNVTEYIFLRNIKTLTMKKNQHNFKMYENIKNYHILNASLIDIEPGAFHGLSKMFLLNIRDCKLTVLLENMFLGLDNLEILDVEGNQIQTLHSGSFTKLFRLNELLLANNLIRIIPAFVFSDLQELHSLHLENNNIETIEYNAFKGLTNLGVLDLSNNSLGTIKTTTFNKLKTLLELHLDNNKIETIIGLFELPGLKFLHLNDNLLSSLDRDLFQSCESLESVDLARNKLKNLDENVFITLGNLKSLHIIGNDLSGTNLTALRKKVLVTPILVP